MTRSLAIVALLTWAGAALVLAELARFRRTDRVARIAPHLPGIAAQRSNGTAGALEQLAPVARDAGTRLASLFGVDEDLSVRLERVHESIGATEFRIRQIAVSLAALVGTMCLCLVLSLPLGAIVMMGIGAPLLAFLVIEARLAHRSDMHKRAVVLELPVVSEQLGMLVASGRSLGSAIERITERSNGVIATDLRRVAHRVRQGLTEERALREWADIVDVTAVDRLVAVVALHHETPDLGRLISEEARATRAESHRELVDRIERRSQQVWIPVTVATLVPGVLFLAIPFTAALSLFAGG